MTLLGQSGPYTMNRTSALALEGNTRSPSAQRGSRGESRSLWGALGRDFARARRLELRRGGEHRQAIVGLADPLSQTPDEAPEEVVGELAVDEHQVA